MARGVRTFLAAVAGCFVGIFVLGAVGYGLGALYVSLLMPDSGLDALVPPLIGVIAGTSIGGTVGIAMGVVYGQRDRKESRH